MTERHVAPRSRILRYFSKRKFAAHGPVPKILIIAVSLLLMSEISIAGNIHEVRYSKLGRVSLRV
jgi:hypothetical protein